MSTAYFEQRAPVQIAEVPEADTTISCNVPAAAGIRRERLPAGSVVRRSLIPIAGSGPQRQAVPPMNLRRMGSRSATSSICRVCRSVPYSTTHPPEPLPDPWQPWTSLPPSATCART